MFILKRKCRWWFGVVLMVVMARQTMRMKIKMMMKTMRQIRMRMRTRMPAMVVRVVFFP